MSILKVNTIQKKDGTQFPLIGQVVYGSTNTGVNCTTSAQVDTGLSASITPSSTSSKILIIVDQAIAKTNYNTYLNLWLYRDSTELRRMKRNMLYTSDSTIQYNSISFSYLDSPSSTASITYKTTFNNVAGIGDTRTQIDNSYSGITLMEVLA